MIIESHGSGVPARAAFPSFIEPRPSKPRHFQDITTRHPISTTKAAATTRKMSSKKRVSVSPASVAGLKRQFSFDAIENLQCLICQELVVDAVQVLCCGALHCRACISKCDRCPQCRKHVNADCIGFDVRCERLSAAYVRPCRKMRLQRKSRFSHSP